MEALSCARQTNNDAQLKQKLRDRTGGVGLLQGHEQHTAMVVVEMGPTHSAGPVRVTARTVSSKVEPEACTRKFQL